MSILDRLKEDHEEAKQLITRIVESEDKDERKTLFKEFASKISAHNEAEELVFYKRMEKHDESRFTALEGEEEHDVADRVLQSLGKSTAKDSDRWTARATVLKELLEHHVEEEEDEAFEKARAIFSADELEAMGEEFERKKQSLMK
jgi:hemerythrin superfamily protein